MSTEITAKQNLESIITSPIVVKNLNDCLGSEKKASAFASSVISVVTGNHRLRVAEPMSIIGAAMVAATLDLPVIPTLGEAYIIPYNDSRRGVTMAQFQIGWKGLYQLCIRSGQFKNIIAEPVHEGELVKADVFTGEFIFDSSKKKSEKVIGYMANFQLVNGFSKTDYWSLEKVKAHATRYSQAYRQGRDTPWVTDFDSMAKKTVLKNLLNRFAPKSIEMENALRFDQAVVNVAKNSDNITEDDLNIDSFDGEKYIDNDSNPTEEEKAQADNDVNNAIAKVEKALRKQDAK